MAALLGCAGYMEYYVQRHGNQAAMSYAVMIACLCGYVALVLGLWAAARKERPVSLVSSWVSGTGNE